MDVLNGSKNGSERQIKFDSRRLDVAMAIAGIKTDEELGKRAGIDKRTIWNARNLGKINFTSLNGIAAALGCNPIDLLVTPGFPDPKWEALADLSV